MTESEIKEFLDAEIPDIKKAMKGIKHRSALVTLFGQMWRRCDDKYGNDIGLKQEFANRTNQDPEIAKMLSTIK